MSVPVLLAARPDGFDRSRDANGERRQLKLPRPEWLEARLVGVAPLARHTSRLEGPLLALALLFAKPGFTVDQRECRGQEA
eukprot:3001343-Alexandrium_andersonii.AAC.1